MAEMTALTSLPPELFLTIFSHLPQRTIRTIVSPLETVVRNSPSKRALQDISLSSSYLRDVSKPFIFEAVTITSIQKLKNFVESGTAERVGGYVRRLWLRWESFGDLLKLEQQTGREEEIEEVMELVKQVLICMPGLRSLHFDFPGAFQALEAILAEESTVQELQSVNIRNGRWEVGHDVRPAIQALGRLRRLKALTLEGINISNRETPVSTMLLESVLFPSLNALSVSGLATVCDRTISSVVTAARNLTSLTIKNCSAVSLSATRVLLISHGYKLRHLSLEILKPTSTATDEISPDIEHRHIPEAEHLCPVIRDSCRNLKILELYTDKICKEVLFQTVDNRGGSGAMTGGLPTPPGSPALTPTTVLDIPTPPFEALNSRRSSDVSSTMLPPPLFTFPYTYNAEQGKPAVTTERIEPIKSVSLWIPYDSSCYGAGSKGPSLQQRFTSLCDGMPAKELLEIGRKAFEEGLVEIVKIRGHWKGGPHLIMKD